MRLRVRTNKVGCAEIVVVAVMWGTVPIVGRVETVVVVAIGAAGVAMTMVETGMVAVVPTVVVQINCVEVV